MNAPKLDQELAHKFFSASCFNHAWDFIDKASRTDDDNFEMIHLAHASIWHWMQRADCTEKNLSIGYWQLSRIYALVGDANSARAYGQRCLQISPNDDPFLVGYAHEALARAELVANNADQLQQHKDEAKALAEKVTDEESRKMLLSDLESLATKSN